MLTDNIIEIIVMVGVVWNAILQTYWFIWSKIIHERKHLTDNSDLEILQFFKDRIDFLESELSDAITEISKIAKGDCK